MTLDLRDDEAGTATLEDLFASEAGHLLPRTQVGEIDCAIS